MYKVSNSPVYCLQGIPNSTYMVVGGDDMTLVNIETGTTTGFPRVHYSHTNALDISQDRLVSSNLNTINHWDLGKSEVLKTIKIPGKENINHLQFMNPNVVVSGGDSCYINVIDLRAGKVAYNLKVSEDNINTVRVRGNDTIHVSSNDNRFCTVDLRSDQLITRTFDSNHSTIDFKLVSPNVLMNLLETGAIDILDLANNNVLNNYSVMSTPLKYHHRFDYRAASLVVGSDSGQILVYHYNQATHMIVPKKTYLPDNTAIMNHVAFFNHYIVGVSNKGFLYKYNSLPS